jgi:hypothetical protein
MNLPSRESLAALFATVMESRYGAQEFTTATREDYVRAAMDTDPVVLLEAAWEYWTKGTHGFRPSPGQLRELASKWVPPCAPYISLRDAVAVDSKSISPGLQALINRFGPVKFGQARGQVLPSHERAWAEVNGEHRTFCFAKARMIERDNAPWNKSETKGLHLGGVRDALSIPERKTETSQAVIATGLAQEMCLTSNPRTQ